MQDNAPLVVVIDDDEAICRAVARFSGAEGYRVRTYNDRARLSRRDATRRVPRACSSTSACPTSTGSRLGSRDARGRWRRRGRVHDGDRDIPTVVEAMKEGAVDLLAKPFTPGMLSVAIDRGDRFRPARPRRAARARRRLARLERLTPREAEVCALVACGLLNKRVAARIGTKEKTVKVHRGRVMQKLHLTSVAELVRLVDTVHARARADARSGWTASTSCGRASADIIIDVIAKDRERNRNTRDRRAPMDQRTMTRAPVGRP